MGCRHFARRWSLELCVRARVATRRRCRRHPGRACGSIRLASTDRGSAGGGVRGGPGRGSAGRDGVEQGGADGAADLLGGVQHGGGNSGVVGVDAVGGQVHPWADGSTVDPCGQLGSGGDGRGRAGPIGQRGLSWRWRRSSGSLRRGWRSCGSDGNARQAGISPREYLECDRWSEVPADDVRRPFREAARIVLSASGAAAELPTGGSMLGPPLVVEIEATEQRLARSCACSGHVLLRSTRPRLHRRCGSYQERIFKCWVMVRLRPGVVGLVAHLLGPPQLLSPAALADQHVLVAGLGAEHVPHDPAGEVPNFTF